MLQLRRQLDLAEESIGTERGREVGPQHLDRDLPMVLEVLREIHRPHAAASQLPLQAVAVAKGFGELGRDVAHDYGRVNSEGCAAAARLRISATSCVMPAVSAR